MKYTTKNYNEFKNLASLHLNAFDKWVSQESNLPEDVIVSIKDTRGYQTWYDLYPLSKR
jgi:hypothetical protein